MFMHILPEQPGSIGGGMAASLETKAMGEGGMVCAFQSVIMLIYF